MVTMGVTKENNYTSVQKNANISKTIFFFKIDFQI